MGMNKPDMHDVMELRRTMLLFDDFQEYISGASNGSGWTSVLKSTGTAAVGDGFGGLLVVTTAASLNDDNYVKGSHQIFGFQNNKPFIGECFLQYAEANVNKANIVFGFMSGVATGAMADNTGEPKASYSGAVIYKVPGGTQWKTNSSVGSTQTTTQSDTPAGGSNFTRLLIEVMPVSSTLAEVTYWVDGIQLKAAGGRPGQTKIKDQLTYTGSTAFAIFFGVKSGSGTAESVTVDYCGAEELRALFTGF